MAKKTGMPNGRPRLFNKPEELEILIDAYFDDCRDRQRQTTIAGLAVALKVDRQTIYNYRDRDEFFGLIKEARDRILANLEEEMMIKGTAGQIFLAKNYGYADSQQMEINQTINRPYEGLTKEQILKTLGEK